MQIPLALRAGIVPAVAAATLAAAACPVSAVASAKAPAKVAVTADRLAAVKTAKQINYYPSAAGWTKMWTSFDAATIDADLAKARGMGATSVRVMVFPSVFGYPAPKADYTAKLAKFVTMAAAHNMTVKLTLFDWWDGYQDVAGSSSWATAILAPYRNDARIVSVDLQNELDPDNAAAMAWAKRLVPVVKAAVPSTPVTISVNTTARLAKMKAAIALDYYDFHLYGYSERALSTIKKAQAIVAPAPLVIGETGVSSLTFTEGEQAAFLARVFQAASAAGITSVAPWTLYDFTAGAIPDSAVARTPAE